MPTTRILVLANRTVEAPTLHAALAERARQGPLAVCVLMPTGPHAREGAQKRLDRALAKLHEAGVTAQGCLAPEDPLVAVGEAYDNRRFDEIIVSTLTSGSSPWLASGLPERVRRMTDAIVRHVIVPVAESAPPQVRPAPRPTASPPLLDRMLTLLRVDTNRVGHPQG